MIARRDGRAVHEAGHCLALLAEGGAIERVEVHAYPMRTALDSALGHGPWYGRTWPAAGAVLSDEAAARFTMAGAVAVDLAVQAGQLARGELAGLSCESDAQAVPAGHSRDWLKKQAAATVRLLRAHLDDLIRLADELQERSAMTGEEIGTFLRRRRWPSRT